MDRKVRKYTFFFFSERQRELGRSSKSYRHIFLQARRQTAQPVWDSSPVCESLKCAFWPEDGEDQLSNIALTNLVQRFDIYEVILRAQESSLHTLANSEPFTLCHCLHLT